MTGLNDVTEATHFKVVHYTDKAVIWQRKKENQSDSASEIEIHGHSKEISHPEEYDGLEAGKVNYHLYDIHVKWCRDAKQNIPIVASDNIKLPELLCEALNNHCDDKRVREKHHLTLTKKPTEIASKKKHNNNPNRR